MQHALLLLPPTHDTLTRSGSCQRSVHSGLGPTRSEKGIPGCTPVLLFSGFTSLFRRNLSKRAIYLMLPYTGRSTLDMGLSCFRTPVRPCRPCPQLREEAVRRPPFLTAFSHTPCCPQPGNPFPDILGVKKQRSDCRMSTLDSEGLGLSPGSALAC